MGTRLPRHPSNQIATVVSGVLRALSICVPGALAHASTAMEQEIPSARLSADIPAQPLAALAGQTGLQVAYVSGLKRGQRSKFAKVSPPDGVTVVSYETGQGEHQTLLLSDNSVLHFSARSAVAIRYGRSQQPVLPGSGEAEVAIAGESLAAPTTVGARRAVSWLRREIKFEHEPLERVAREFNRYSAKRIEILTPALRNLEISGVFTLDDTAAFIAFLRSLPGVHVEVTATQIRVTRDTARERHAHSPQEHAA